MAHTNRDRTLALAGLFQAAHLVKQVARSGTCDSDDIETSLRSLFNTDPPSVEDVYGGVQGLRTGLRVLTNQLGTDGRARDMELTKYAVNLLHLERKLRQRKDLLGKIGSGIERTRSQLDHFSLTHGNIVASLADTYTNTVSTIPPRIMVSGEPGYLNNPDVANRIRALLLAGIRSAVLWGQCGGGRLTMILARGKLVQEAQQLLGRPTLH